MKQAQFALHYSLFQSVSSGGRMIVFLDRNK